MTYRGKCPICSGQLKVVNIVFLECENGDYACSLAAFEALWENLENEILVLYKRILIDLKNIDNISHKSEQETPPDEPGGHQS